MTTPLIILSGLVKRYGAFTAVEDLSLEVAEGEVFALLGPNGAGKTTTIRLLMGILQPTAGRVQILGMDCGVDRATIMQHVGYVPDEPEFYDYLRARELLQFVGQMHGLAAGELTERIGELAGQLDLTDVLEEFAVNFSHGMKKKLAAASALLHRPKLLILDEPTNGLDPYATRTMHELIARHADAGGSVFLSTHLLDQAERLSDRVGILVGGHLRACGNLEELRRQVESDASLEEVFFALTSTDQAPPPSSPNGQAAPSASPPPEAKGQG